MPSVKNLEKGDIMGISKIVNEEKDKNVNSLLLQKLSTKTCNSSINMQLGEI